MNKSEQINELVTALAKAQGEMTVAIKDSANQFFKSRYADLASVWDAVRGPLSRNGLAVAQFVRNGPEGTTAVETILGHASGQWIGDTIYGKPVKDDPQGMGSLITYLRRYALSAICGIAPDDDDAEAAQGRGTQGKYQEKPQTKEKAPPQDSPLQQLTRKAMDCKHASLLADLRTVAEGMEDTTELQTTIKQRMFQLLLTAVSTAKDDGALDRMIEFAKKDKAFGEGEKITITEAALKRTEELHKSS